MGVFQPVMVRLHPAACEGEHTQPPRGHRSGGGEHRILVEHDEQTVITERIGTSI